MDLPAGMNLVASGHKHSNTTQMVLFSVDRYKARLSANGFTKIYVKDSFPCM